MTFVIHFYKLFFYFFILINSLVNFYYFPTFITSVVVRVYQEDYLSLYPSLWREKRRQSIIKS